MVHAHDAKHTRVHRTHIPSQFDHHRVKPISDTNLNTMRCVPKQTQTNAAPATAPKMSLYLIMVVLCSTLGHGTSNPTVGDVSTSTSIEHEDYCGDIPSQTEVDLHQISGIWFGNELLHHDAADPSANKTNCIIVELIQESTTVRPEVYPITDRPTVYKKQLGYEPSRPSYQHGDDPATVDRHSHDYLRLTWDDQSVKGGVVEYTLHYNQTKRGTWRTPDAYASSYGRSDDEPYQSPHRGAHQATVVRGRATTFLVSKAVSNQVVLTMCQTMPRRRLLSITLSRPTNPLSVQDLDSVRVMLRRRQMSIYSRQPLCFSQTNNGASLGSTTIVLCCTVMLLSAVGRMMMLNNPFV